MNIDQILTSNPIRILLFCLLLVFLAINQNIVSLVYAAICILALLGPKQAIQALAINYVMLPRNPVLYHLPGEVSWLRWIILLVAGLRVLPLISKCVLRILLYLFLFYLVVVGLAWMESPNFIISLLKITIFTSGVAVKLTAFSCLDKLELEDFKKWFFCLIAALLILSLPTLFISSIGFARNGRGFQGLLNHPQAFALLVVPIATYMVAELLLKKERSGI